MKPVVIFDLAERILPTRVLAMPGSQITDETGDETDLCLHSADELAALAMALKLSSVYRTPGRSSDRALCRQRRRLLL